MTPETHLEALRRFNERNAVNNATVFPNIEIDELTQFANHQAKLIDALKGALETYLDHWETYDECGYLSVPDYEETKQALALLDKPWRDL